MKTELRSHLVFVLKVAFAQSLSTGIPFIMMMILASGDLFGRPFNYGYFLKVAQALIYLVIFIMASFTFCGLPYAIIGRLFMMVKEKKAKSLSTKRYALLLGTALSVFLLCALLVLGRSDWNTLLGAMIMFLFQIPTIWYFSKLAQKESLK
jgi:hypothetical protein